MISWELAHRSEDGKVEVHRLDRDGDCLGFVTVDYGNRVFDTGFLESGLAWNPKAPIFEGVGWRQRLLQAAKEHLAKIVEF